MGRFIIKIDDYYLEWSTIVDAPVTYGMPLEEFKKYYLGEYGRSSMIDLDRRLERVEKYGTSVIDGLSVKDLIVGNRAGPDETSLTLREIKKAFCLHEPIKNNLCIGERGWYKDG